MDQRVSLITLGVADVGRAGTFYERLGWQGQEVEETVFFQESGLRPRPGWLDHRADFGT